MRGRRLIHSGVRPYAHVVERDNWVAVSIRCLGHRSQRLQRRIKSMTKSSRLARSTDVNALELSELDSS